MPLRSMRNGWPTAVARHLRRRSASGRGCRGGGQRSRRRRSRRRRLARRDAGADVCRRIAARARCRSAARATWSATAAAAIVIDAGNALGQLTAHQAVRLAVARAQEHRHGDRRGAQRLPFRHRRPLCPPDGASKTASASCMSNTRPLMPAPGGARGASSATIPIAIALPAAGDFPVEVDMALSATAMGKIRLAAAAGQSIPADWAIDADRAADHRSGRGDQGHAAAGRGPERLRPRLRHRSPVRRACPTARSARRFARSTAIPRSPIAAAQFFIAIHAGHFPAGRSLRRARARSGRARERVETQPGRRSRLRAGRARCVRRGRPVPAICTLSRQTRRTA